MLQHKRVITVDFLINVLFPLLMGVLIYRLRFITIHPFIKNYIPDALWAYAFVSSILNYLGQASELLLAFYSSCFFYYVRSTAIQSIN
jgi:hypothetical protein